MPANKQMPGRARVEGPGKLDGLLEQIEGEKVPERLLELAQELQRVLNLRRAKLSPDEH